MIVGGTYVCIRPSQSLVGTCSPFVDRWGVGKLSKQVIHAVDMHVSPYFLFHLT